MYSILVPPPFHIASLSVIPQSFQGGPRSWPGVNGLASMSFQSVRFVHTKIANFEMFFCTTSIFLAKWSIVTYCTPYLFWKLLFWRLIWHIRGPSTCILWPVFLIVGLTMIQTPISSHITSLDLTGKTQASWLDNMQIPLSRFFLLIQKSFC